MQPGSLRDKQLQSLAKENRKGIVGSETDWLEWKSALDVFVGEAPSTRRLSVGWSATSKSASGVVRGTTELPLADTPVAFDGFKHDLDLS